MSDQPLVNCTGCKRPLNFDFSMAFQPIVDVAAGTIFAHEALVRGTGGEPAGAVLNLVDDENRFAFDQRCRIKAVEMAAALGMESLLSINFMPNVVYEPTHCLQTTYATTERTGFPPNRIIFEVIEGERVTDHARLKVILSEYKRLGFLTAIDDFGAGYAGLNLLADFQPDLIKVDKDLIRDIDSDRVRRTIVAGIVQMCRTLDVSVIGEGVETEAEAHVLAAMGISLMQGYYFARPGFEALPPIALAA